MAERESNSGNGESDARQVPVARRVLTAVAPIEVPFHDVDTMNVCWHGHYVKYFEIARGVLLRSFDYDYPEMRATGYVWPVVECYLKYVRPAVYGQRIEVRAELLEFENRLKFGYLITDRESGARLTKGYTIQVAVCTQTEALQYVSPQVLFDKLERTWSS
jgi:acyl-CoA thioester hydrolase